MTTSRGREMRRQSAGQLLAAAVCAGCVFLGACGTTSVAPPPAPAKAPPAKIQAKPKPILPGAFADVTAASGIDFVYRNGE